jgi:hypothetical protein
MPIRQVILSSAASNPARIGFGIIEQMNTSKGPALPRRTIILWTNPCLDQPDGSPPTGKISCWVRDDALSGAFIDR